MSRRPPKKKTVRPRPGHSNVFHSEPTGHKVIEWTWTGLAAVPELNDVWSTPTIGQLTDDNGDGVIDGNDGPDIALIAFHESNENPGGVATTPPSSCWTARPEPSTGTSWT